MILGSLLFVFRITVLNLVSIKSKLCFCTCRVVVEDLDLGVDLEVLVAHPLVQAPRFLLFYPNFDHQMLEST